MAVRELQFSVTPLRRSFGSARRWLWLQRSLRTLTLSLCVGAAFALVASLLTLFSAPDAVVSWLWLAAALTPVAGLFSALMLRPSELEAVRAVDHRLDLHQQLGTAYELLGKDSPSALAPWQLALASDVAGSLALSRAFPLAPKRELLMALLLSAATAGALLAVSLGVTLSNPFEALKIPGITKETLSSPDRQLFGNGAETKDSRQKSAAMESTRQMLNQIQRQAQRGTLSEAAAANALSQANNELNRAAQESLVRQEALDRLAAQLRGTAAGNEIAQTLRQGDYQKASEQIRELGRQTDQLSQAAKDHLSQALSSSAAQSQALQQLARAENRAAQALQKPQSGETVYSMDRLAQAVEEASRQIVSQSELSETWQQLDDLNKQLAGGDRGNSAEASRAPSAAQSSDGSGEKSSTTQQGGPPGGEQQSGDGSVGHARRRQPAPLGKWPPGQHAWRRPAWGAESAGGRERQRVGGARQGGGPVLRSAGLQRPASVSNEGGGRQLLSLGSGPAGGGRRERAGGKRLRSRRSKDDCS